VVGFEPQPDALAKLNARKSGRETYLPHVVGDGAPATLRVCQESGMTSLLRLDASAAAVFRGFETYGRVLKEVPVETRRLDDIAEVGEVDFLKIDIQGSELAVFRNGANRLSRAVAVQTEISFVALYEGQPSFAQIDLELRQHGFIPHSFAELKKWMIHPMYIEGDPYAAVNQLLEGDMIYVRDFTRPDAIETEQFKHLALIAHHCYRSFDLAMHCLHRLTGRGAVPQDAVPRYLEHLFKTQRPKS
jgi:FkbM family methyltransferase